MKGYHDRGSKELSKLRIGDKVKVRNFKEKEWLDGEVMGIRDSPRSYNMKLNATNNIVSRNRKHLVYAPHGSDRETAPVRYNYELPGRKTEGHLDDVGRELADHERGNGNAPNRVIPVIIEDNGPERPPRKVPPLSSRRC